MLSCLRRKFAPWISFGLFFGLLIGALFLAAPEASAAFDAKTLPADLKSVMVGDVPFVYSEQGQGDPLVILSPYPFSTALWADFAKRLSASARVIVVEPPGMRDAASMKADYTAIHLLFLYRDFAKAIGLTKARYLGVGESGALAVAISHHWPEQVIAAISINGLESAGMSENVSNMLKLFKMAGSGGPEMLLAGASARFRDKPPADAGKLVLLADDDQKKAFTARLQAYTDDIAQAIIPAMLPNLNRPILLIRSKDDQMLTQELIDRTRKFVKSGGLIKYEVVPDAGHFAFIDQPDKVAELVRAFLNANPVSTAAN